MTRISIHKEGYTIILFAALFLVVFNIFLFWTSAHSTWRWILFAFSILTFLWVCYFFRNPERDIEYSENHVYAPADGTIVAIEKTHVDEYFGKEMIQVSIFMSAFNIHVNRYPVDGVVKYTNYSPGRHLLAFHPKSSSENEQFSTVVEDKQGRQIMIRQIAGAMARRIVNYAQLERPITQGDELGFIKFGSRVDLFLPPDTTLEIKLKQKVYGNKTVIARFDSARTGNEK